MFKPYAGPLQPFIKALEKGLPVYGKNIIGDWIQVDAFNEQREARVADALSGFNDGTVGEWQTFRDFEIQ